MVNSSFIILFLTASTYLFINLNLHLERERERTNFKFAFTRESERRRMRYFERLIYIDIVLNASKPNIVGKKE